jgi:hypothetical protein
MNGPGWSLSIGLSDAQGEVDVATKADLREPVVGIGSAIVMLFSERHSRG